jgi:hypothetical protein
MIDWLTDLTRPIRRRLHERGVHRFCRSGRIIDHYEYVSNEYLVGPDRVLDVTTFGGTRRPVYRDGHF